jgi:hypothetical protein
MESETHTEQDAMFVVKNMSHRAGVETFLEMVVNSLS